jgi:hypothetical protein
VRSKPFWAPHTLGNTVLANFQTALKRLKVVARKSGDRILEGHGAHTPMTVLIDHALEESLCCKG